MFLNSFGFVLWWRRSVVSLSLNVGSNIFDFWGSSDLLGGVSVRSNNSTPVGGPSGTTSQSRKSPLLGDNGKEENQRTSSRGSGGGNRSQQNDRGQQQRGGNGRSNSRGRARGSNAGSGPNTGGRSQGGQGSFNRFARDFNNRSKGPLKFDEDYDFESANVKVSLLFSCFKRRIFID